MHCLASLSRLTKRPPPQSCLAPEVKGGLSIFFVCGVFSLSRVSPHLDCLACSQQQRLIMLTICLKHGCNLCLASSNWPLFFFYYYYYDYSDKFICISINLEINNHVSFSDHKICRIRTSDLQRINLGPDQLSYILRPEFFFYGTHTKNIYFYLLEMWFVIVYFLKKSSYLQTKHTLNN